jgi:two-component system, cell cycle sensor histidine kinase and response regulator CckA
MDTIIPAEDGEDALAKFGAHPEIMLVILDSVMPKKNGRVAFDAMKQLRPEVKAIFISGYTRDIVLDKGIKEGDINFLSKPSRINKLLEMIRDVLDR